MITVEGGYTFNGHSMSKAIRRSIGYVSQDDLLYENLTVYETLYYAALLRLPKTMTREQKLGRVEAVIEALGLEKCRDTLIGQSIVSKDPRSSALALQGDHFEEGYRVERGSVCLWDTNC